MERDSDLPSPEISTKSRRFFVDRVYTLLPSATWQAVEIKFPHVPDDYAEQATPIKEIYIFMSSASYKLGDVTLVLQAVEPLDAPSFVRVIKHHPATPLEAVVDHFEITTDLTESSFSSTNTKLRNPFRIPTNLEEFYESARKEEQTLELQNITGMNIFTEDIFLQIKEDLSQCSEDNRIA